MKAFVGQSIADNIAAEDDFELSSGLQGTRSDIVGLVEFNLNGRLSSTTRLRYDDDESALRRIDTSFRYRGDIFSLTGNYFRLDDATQIDDEAPNEEFRGAATFNLNDNWSLRGNLTYDIDTDNVRRQSYGITYKDDCTRIDFLYRTRRVGNNAIRSTQGFSLRVTLISLGNFGTNQ